MNNYRELILQALPALENKLLENEMMSRHTTFRIGGQADLYICPSQDELVDLVGLCRKENIPFTIIGNGSNILVGDRGIRGLVIEIGKAMEDINIDKDFAKNPEDEEEYKTLSVGAGALLSRVASEAAKEGLSGMETLSGIPGTVGGAVAMNAGAYGGEVKDILVSAKLLTKDGDIIDVDLEGMDLSYRHSRVFDKEDIVLSAVFKLIKKDEDQIRALMNELKDKRVEKQPLNFPSAGSTFKRPEGYFAGKLIMDAGLRGYTVGGAQVSEKHCGFVVNKGEASAADVMDLIADVHDKVMDKFGVELEPEVRMLGEF